MTQPNSSDLLDVIETQYAIIDKMQAYLRELWEESKWGDPWGVLGTPYMTELSTYLDLTESQEAFLHAMEHDNA